MTMIQISYKQFYALKNHLYYSAWGTYADELKQYYFVVSLNFQLFAFKGPYKCFDSYYLFIIGWF